MSEGNPQQTVLLIIGSSTGIVLLARTLSDPKAAVRQPGGMLRIVLGGSIAAYGLMFLAPKAPKLATGLAALILMGTLYEYIVPIADRVGSALTGKKEYLPADVVKKTPATRVPTKTPKGN